jgi:hypothetical protein
VQALLPPVPIQGGLSLGAKLPQHHLDVRLEQLAVANALTGLETVAITLHSSRSIHTRAGKAKLDSCREWAGIVNVRQLILLTIHSSVRCVASLHYPCRCFLCMKSHHAERA